LQEVIYQQVRFYKMIVIIIKKKI